MQREGERERIKLSYMSVSLPVCICVYSEVMMQTSCMYDVCVSTYLAELLFLYPCYYPLELLYIRIWSYCTVHIWSYCTVHISGATILCISAAIILCISAAIILCIFWSYYTVHIWSYYTVHIWSYYTVHIWSYYTVHICSYCTVHISGATVLYIYLQLLYCSAEGSSPTCIYTTHIHTYIHSGRLLHMKR